MSWLWLLWLLVPIVLGVVIYKVTTPTFLIELATAVFKAAISAILKSQIFKSSPHSKEYWDVFHESTWSPYERAEKEARLKAILADEASGKLKVQ